MSSIPESVRPTRFQAIKIAFISFAALAIVGSGSLLGLTKSGTENRTLIGASAPRAGIARSWDPKAAAAYLDQRATSWMAWSYASRDHGTFCISCHTVVPYMLARPALRRALAESGPSEDERRLLDNVTERVRLWKEMLPFYSDKQYGEHKAEESRSTEAVLNALLLASVEAQSGQASEDARLALRNMWELQQTTGDRKGAWLWQQFGLRPWESSSSTYYGATLAMAAAGLLSDNYRSAPEIQDNLKMTREYLDREFGQQPTLNRVYLLWASSKIPDLVSSERRAGVIQEILNKQQTDGGWNVFTLAKTWRDWSFSSLVGNWKRNDGTPQDLRSDGFATGLATYVLEEAGVPRDNAQLQRALSWLVQNQDKTEGAWTAYSINRRRNPTSMTGHFMTDAATAYAVLALTRAD